MLPFIRQAVRDFTHTGAVWPSSRRLAAEMTRSLGDSQVVHEGSSKSVPALARSPARC